MKTCKDCKDFISKTKWCEYHSAYVTDKVINYNLDTRVRKCEGFKRR